MIPYFRTTIQPCKRGLADTLYSILYIIKDLSDIDHIPIMVMQSIANSFDPVGVEYSRKP